MFEQYVGFRNLQVEFIEEFRKLLLLAYKKSGDDSEGEGHPLLTSVYPLRAENFGRVLQKRALCISYVHSNKECAQLKCLG